MSEAAEVCVFGLWHLGSVTAACLAQAGFAVAGLDSDGERVASLARGTPPVAEPGLADLVQEQAASGRLRFTSDPSDALRNAQIMWITHDTPVDEDDHADTGWLRAEIDSIRQYVTPDTLIILSSQVPVGFTRALEKEWSADKPSLQFAYSPENLRLGRALEAFRQPERIVVGLGAGADRGRLAELLAPFSTRIEWMTLASAEMTKHALNGFLATSVAFTNELARICEQVGADAQEVERGLRGDPRIGSRAYVTPGPPFAGGTLARDIRFLSQLAHARGLESPIMDAVWHSNQLHSAWSLAHVDQLVVNIQSPVVAVLGLTYKPGTDTLRRSSAVELARHLINMNVVVNAFDPGVRTLPSELQRVHLVSGVDEALSGADAVVLATPWPDFRDLSADQLVASMRRPAMIDPFGMLAHLQADPRITYRRVGAPVHPTFESR